MVKTEYSGTTLTSTPNITVAMAPPMKPSQVFFGDSLMSGVRPKKKPNMYAMMSLQMIIDTGTRNLNRCAHSLPAQVCILLVCYNSE